MGEVEELREKLAALELWKKEKLVQLKKLTEGICRQLPPTNPANQSIHHHYGTNTHLFST